MADALNLFPDRAAIGRVDARGNVYMTPEFSRALAGVLVRIGGPVGTNMDELANELAVAGASALGLDLTRRMAELERQIAQATQLVATLGELRKRLDGVELAGVSVATPTDWEHPGKIGAGKASTGTFSSINRVTITAPAGTATLTLADGKTFTVSNTLTLAGTDGAALNIGAGGTLGSAAYKNTTDFAARSPTALAAVATDPATTQALANSLRAVLLSVGIGS